jgi:transcription initiation factor TFIID subunit 3
MDQPRVASTSAYFHALLRPVILQILRAQGYYSITPGLLDAFTDLAARHLEELCFRAARNAEHNHEFLPGLNLTDTRQAMEQCGVFGTPDEPTAEAWRGENTQGIEKFVQWVMGDKNAKIRRVALGSVGGNLEAEGEEEPATDYLSGA